MRLLAFALAIFGILILGRAVYEILFYAVLPWAALLIGSIAIALAYGAYQRSRNTG